jgi:serine protease Do
MITGRGLAALWVTGGLVVALATSAWAAAPVEGKATVPSPTSTATPATPATPAAPTTPAVSAAPTASAAVAAQPDGPGAGVGQRLYERTRPQLLQVRTLLKTQDSQTSVGSGFLVSTDGLLVTNYHVVSQFALQPTRHRLVYATVDGQQGALQLLAFDVVNDLALLRATDASLLAGRGAVALRPAGDALPRGARVFALGNPLDVGFAVAEGTYNGPVERSFLQTLFFGGSLSSGMSGGPALDEQGRLVGVNVATRRDGEQVSFLVPAQAVRDLLARAPTAKPVTVAAWDDITQQVKRHEAELTRRFIALPWREAGHPHYRIPVPQEQFMRCWGRGSAQSERGLQFERSDCVMDSRVFISQALLTGFLVSRHEAYDGSRLGALRFAERYSASFANEFMGLNERHRGAAQCVERTVQAGAALAAAGAPDKTKPASGAAAARLPLKAVICLRAYKKLEGLYDLSVLVATLDQTQAGVQGRFDAYGVSLPSSQRLAQHYLDGFAWNATASR